MPSNTTVTFSKTPNSLESQHTSNRLLNLPEELQVLIWSFVYQQTMIQLRRNHVRNNLELEIDFYMSHCQSNVYINDSYGNSTNYYWNNYYYKEANNYINNNYINNNYINN